MPGPRKIPSHLKVIAGTDRSDRAPPSDPRPALPLLEHAPPAPDWLPNPHAIAEWNRVAPILAANGLLSEAALSPLGMYCALHGKILLKMGAGDMPTAHLMAQYRGMANDFGLTGVAEQGKGKPSAEKPRENRFSRFGKRPT